MQESKASLVRIHTADGRMDGAGFLVGERHILTCAHVVARALGLTDDAPEKPQVPVSLDIPRVAPRQLLTARVVLWRPPRTDGRLWTRPPGSCAGMFPRRQTTRRQTMERAGPAARASRASD